MTNLAITQLISLANESMKHLPFINFSFASLSDKNLLKNLVDVTNIICQINIEKKIIQRSNALLYNIFRTKLLFSSLSLRKSSHPSLYVLEHTIFSKPSRYFRVLIWGKIVIQVYMFQNIAIIEDIQETKNRTRKYFH